MTFKEQLLLTILPIIITSLMSFVIGRITKKSDKRDEEVKERDKTSELLQAGMREILRVKLIEYHKEYTTKGSIPSYAYDNFAEMYDTYHQLGGNGMITKMFDEIKKLPIQKD